MESRSTALKSIVGQPLQILHSASSPVELRERMGEGLGATVAVSVLAGLACVSTGLGLGGTTGRRCSPWVSGCPHADSGLCRMAFFAADRPWSAAAIDAAWALVGFPLLAASLSAATPHWAG